MYTKNVLAVSGALIAAVAAVPMAKRDIVWVTETHEDIVTMPVTTTVWVNPGETAPSHYGHHHHSSKLTSTIQSTVTVPAVPASTPEPAPVPSSVESTYVAPPPSSTEVAPTTSSTSVYVAPTTSTSVYVAPTTSTSVYVAPTTSTSVYVAPTTSTSVYVAPTTSTSVYVAPTTSSTSVYVAPAPTSTYEAPSTTSEAPAATSTAASSGSGVSGMAAPGTSYTGDMTWYADGLGACGFTNGPSDHIVAISEGLFDLYTVNGNPNLNPLCGKTVTITGVDGSAYTAEIVDRCTGCKDADLDLSEDFFNTVTSNGDGRVHNVSWKFD